MLCFYGWSRLHCFMEAWNDAGFLPVGHMVLLKRYASKSRFMRHQHEQAYLLAKGKPALPSHAISDVQQFEYTGNALHPTQNVSSLAPIIQAFTRPGDLVLDCFCGSASTCASALLTGRQSLGIELDRGYFLSASARMERIKHRIANRRSRRLSLAHRCARVPLAPQDRLSSAVDREMHQAFRTVRRCAPLFSRSQQGTSLRFFHG